MKAAVILERIRHLNVLVVGDICLDRWCRYDPSQNQPSLETGIPRTAVISTDVTPGAGGTVAGNLTALGAATVTTIGILGEDGFGHELLRALERINVCTDLMVRSPAVSTFTYTKLMNHRTGVEDLPRVDHINMRPLPRDAENLLVQNLNLFGPGFDVLLVSDQAETDEGGCVSRPVREALHEMAVRDPGKVLWVDSRRRIELFRGAILKPNREEAEAACTRAVGCVDYARLREHTHSPLLVVTAGADGVHLIDQEGSRHVPTRRMGKPVDICGAGDSFSAGAALALAVTGKPEIAVRFGNMVASITIMKRGTGTASPEEVLRAEAAWPE